MSSLFNQASLVVEPAVYENGKVYATKPFDGTGDLTFTRASNATRVASNGLIEKVRTNLILQSNTFSNAAWSVTNVNTPTANAIANPLTGAVDAWKLVEDATDNFHYILQTPTFAAGEVSFSFYAKAAERTSCSAFLSQGGNVGASFNLSTGVATPSGDGNTASMVALSNGWYRCIVTNNGSSTVANQVRIGVAGGALASYAGDGTSGVYIYAAQAEQGVATDYIATTSAAVSVGPVSGLPRLDYLGSTCPRLLLEPQRTNLIPSSENMTAASIQKLASGTGAAPVVTANQGTSPDGYVNADLVVFDIAGGTTASDVSRLFFTDGATPINASVYVKSSNGSSVYNMFLRCGNSTKQIEVTGQWQRFDVTEPSSGANWQLGLQGDYDNSQSASVLVWGAQLEQGAYATSYIPTLGTSVTRVADAAFKTGISSLIGQTEGTIFAEFQKNVGLDAANMIFSLSDGTSSNLIYYNLVGGVVEILAGGVLVASKGGIVLQNGTNKIAICYKLNDFAIYLNGASIHTDTSGAVPTMSKLNVGNWFNESFPSGTPISQTLLFKTRLTNAQLAELTTL
jgi:hypothetical protein